MYLTPKMNQRVKRKWIAALRSGEYKQGKGYLRKGDRFCCLGVLCDLYRQEMNDPVWDRTGLATQNPARFSEPFAELPSAAVCDWAGLKGDFRNDPVVKAASYGSVTLSDQNDQGYDFTTIADLIQASL